MKQRQDDGMKNEIKSKRKKGKCFCVISGGNVDDII